MLLLFLHVRNMKTGTHWKSQGSTISGYCVQPCSAVTAGLPLVSGEFLVSEVKGVHV